MKKHEMPLVRGSHTPMWPRNSMAAAGIVVEAGESECTNVSSQHALGDDNRAPDLLPPAVGFGMGWGLLNACENEYGGPS